MTAATTQNILGFDPAWTPKLPLGYDLQAIARWDVVLYQTFSAVTTLGVVAFHYNEILQVDYYAGGVFLGSSSKMTLNPTTGIVEYCCDFDPAKFPDGAIEVRAVAWPKAGLQRTLSIVLNTNARKTLPSPEIFVSPNGSDANDGSKTMPKATIGGAVRAAIKTFGTLDGVTIWLAPGNYAYGITDENGKSPLPGPSTTTRFMTIRSSGNVRSTINKSAGGINGINVAFQNLDVSSQDGQTTIGGNGSNVFWFDNVAFSGPGISVNTFDLCSGAKQQRYFTNCSTVNCYTGFADSPLCRYCLVASCGSDGFAQVFGVFNCRVNSIRLGNPEVHTDVVQHVGDQVNVIVYGLKAANCDAQGLPIGNNADGIAYVDCDIDVTAGGGTGFQAGGVKVRHALMVRVKITGPSHFNLPFNPTFMLFDQVTFGPSPLAGIDKFPGIKLKQAA